MVVFGAGSADSFISYLAPFDLSPWFIASDAHDAAAETVVRLLRIAEAHDIVPLRADVTGFIERAWPSTLAEWG